MLRLFPEHAVVFRSVNTVLGPELLDAFRAEGFVEIASRQLYYMRPDDPGFFDKNQRATWKKDRRLLEQGPYELLGHADLGVEDLNRVLEVYNLLYLDKYSRENPRFTPAFIELALREGTLELRALRHRETGRIDGAIGFFIRNGAMTTPLFGYD